MPVNKFRKQSWTQIKAADRNDVLIKGELGGGAEEFSEQLKVSRWMFLGYFIIFWVTSWRRAMALERSPGVFFVFIFVNVASDKQELKSIDLANPGN